MSPDELTRELKNEAHRLGFDLVGTCPAVSPPGLDHFRRWLADGYAGEMSYLAERAPAYAHPSQVLDGARSLLMLAIVYRTGRAEPGGSGTGRISCYAWGRDYHDLLRERLHRLADFHRQRTPGVGIRGVVDTAPLLEREFAQLAGLGWIGKNTLLLNRRLGSWFFLAALLTTAELAYDPPHESNHCGVCRACIEACPTGALVEPFRLDARRCLSYLTIELRGPIPEPLRTPLGDWVFGCDICQDVCPWNRKAPTTEETWFDPRADQRPAQLTPWFFLDDDAFRQRFRHTPLWRPKRRGLLRNAAIVLGNRPDAAATAALVRGLNDAEPLVRGAAAWALHRHGEAGQAALAERMAVETDPFVRAEIEAAPPPPTPQ